MVVGTLKDMGMSHKTSVVTYILIIVIIFVIIHLLLILNKYPKKNIILVFLVQVP